MGNHRRIDYERGTVTMDKQSAIGNRTTMYQHSIRMAGDVGFGKSSARILQPAGSNKKLSAKGTSAHRHTFLRGAESFRGSRLYVVTLVERESCDPACGMRGTCYGNNMPWAIRWRINDAWHTQVESEIRELVARYDRITVRLHELGDFPSVGYVLFWRTMLGMFPTLTIYGYTHWNPSSEIGVAVYHMMADYPTRVSILYSDAAPSEGIAVANAADVSNSHRLPVCPQQTGKASSCLACGLCTLASTIRGVHFLTH